MDKIGLNKTYSEVREFQKAFNHPVAEKPTYMPKERAEKRYKWMLEEIDEFMESDNVVDQSDAMIDLIYFAVGTLVELGVEPENLFNIVQKANMNKLWEDGKPRYNSDGKVIKPSGWVAPEPLIKEEIERQING